MLLVFSDPDCGPCDELAPQLEQVHCQRADLQVLVARPNHEAVLASGEADVVLDLVDVLVELVGLREALAARGEPVVRGRHSHQDERRIGRDRPRVADDGDASQELVGHLALVEVGGELGADGVGVVADGVAAVRELVSVAQVALRGDHRRAADDGDAGQGARHGRISAEHVLVGVDEIVGELEAVVLHQVAVHQFPVTLLKFAIVSQWRGEGRHLSEVRILAPDRQRAVVLAEPSLDREACMVRRRVIRIVAGQVSRAAESRSPALEVGSDEEVRLVLDDGTAQARAVLPGIELGEGRVVAEAGQILVLVVAEERAVEVVGAALGDGVHQAAHEVA